MADQQLQSDEGRRSAARGTADRRRSSWRDFRRTYPGFVKTIAIGVIAMLAIDGWLFAQRLKYDREIDRLRGSMTTAERQKTDLIVQSEQDKVRMAIALARRQAQVDKKLHLSISLDSARMYLEREGALLRTIPVAIGAEGKVAAGSDSIPMPAPRGERTIAQFNSSEIVLDGGTVISAGQVPAAGDSATRGLRPGEVRISQSDMTAILPNISAGMKVYFY
ncbi:MAG: hypothetical protein H0W69_01025 [Gemmatimonadaceae bacterium]|nr:hypothetical protein [Gemmatimonadaceae bacterium]